MGRHLAMSKNRVGAAAGGGIGGVVFDSWLEVKKIVAQENCQGKDLSSQLIQHSMLHTQFMAGLYWVVDESLEYSRNFEILLISCNFKGGVVMVIPPVFPFLALEVTQIPATCNEHFNDLTMSITRRILQRSTAFVVIKSDIDKRILQQQSNN